MSVDVFCPECSVRLRAPGDAIPTHGGDMRCAGSGWLIEDTDRPVATAGVADRFPLSSDDEIARGVLRLVQALRRTQTA